MVFRGFNQTYDLDEVFYVDCGKRITEREVYSNKGELPVLTSTTKNNGTTWFADKEWLKTKGKIFSGPCITWTKEGYAGKLFYREGEFFPIDVVGVLKLREEFEEKVDLRWFLYSQQKNFYKSVYSRGNQGKLYQDTAKKIKFLLVDSDTQKRISKKYEEVEKLQSIINDMISKMDTLLQMKVKLTKSFNANLWKVFDLKGGNSGLTERVIYNNPSLNEKEEVFVYSGSIDSESLLGTVKKDTKIENKLIKLFEGPRIIVTRKGLAGTMVLRNNKLLTINDDAYALTVRNEYKELVDEKWYFYVHESLFKNLSTGKQGNGTFSKNKLKNKNLDFPEISEQKELSNKYEFLFNKRQDFLNLKEKLNSLLEMGIN